MSAAGSTAEAAGPVEVSVVVMSYDRVALLERTLRAALAMRVPPGLTWEIVVPDNHPQRLAETLVVRLAAASAVPIRYVSAPVRNVSIARNTGIRASRGRYVAFVDDDEAPDPGWLAALHACLERTGADAAWGPKYPVFESGRAPEWDPQGWFFTCDFRQPPDSPIEMFNRLRKRGKGLGTGNSIWRVATCFDVPEPFDVAFGNAGGEDTELIFRLARAGRRYVWCPDAVVREFMSADRSRFEYIRTRLRRGSQHYAASRIHTSADPRLARLKVAVLGLGQVAVYGALFALSGEFLTRRRVRNRIGLAKGLGKLTYASNPIGFIDERAARAERLAGAVPAGGAEQAGA